MRPERSRQGSAEEPLRARSPNSSISQTKSRSISQTRSRSVLYTKSRSVSQTKSRSTISQTRSRSTISQTRSRSVSQTKSRSNLRIKSSHSIIDGITTTRDYIRDTLITSPLILLLQLSVVSYLYLQYYLGRQDKMLNIMLSSNRNNQGLQSSKRQLRIIISDRLSEGIVRRKRIAVALNNYAVTRG